jgi:hypothetical protein
VIAVVVKELSKSKERMPHTAEWRLEQGLLLHRGKIYVPKDPELRRRIVAQHHDTRIAGHPGCWKTLKLIAQNYWWPQMGHSLYWDVYQDMRPVSAN